MANTFVAQTKEQLYAEVARLSADLRRFPKGNMGLTPDSVKSSPAYIEAKRAYAAAFSRLQQINVATRRKVPA